MNHENEKNIKCPYCDWADDCSDEFGFYNGDCVCEKCNRKFFVEVHVEAAYSTSRIDCKEIGTEHDYHLTEIYEHKYKYDNRIRVDLPEIEWIYTRIMKCSICGNEKCINSTKDEYLRYKDET